MAVRVTNSQRNTRIPVGPLRKAAETALSSLGYQGAELSLLITGDRKMRALNRMYRGVDKTTDVLSFSMLEGGQGGREGMPTPFEVRAVSGPPVVLGDIVISATKAAAQADERGRTLEEELITLLVHGILHLIGYDHEAGPAEGRKMKRMERELTNLLKKR